MFKIRKFTVCVHQIPCVLGTFPYFLHRNFCFLYKKKRKKKGISFLLFLCTPCAVSILYVHNLITNNITGALSKTSGALFLLTNT